MTEANALTMAIEKGDREAATRLTQEAIDSGRPLEEILDAMVTAMDKIGYEFQCNRAYIPEDVDRRPGRRRRRWRYWSLCWWMRASSMNSRR